MASTMEDSDLLALRSEVLASLKTPAILPISKTDEDEEDLEALRQAALSSIRPASKLNQTNVTPANHGRNHSPFKCTFHGYRRGRGGNQKIMRNCKRSNLIVISTDDVSKNNIKPVIKKSTYFNSNNIKFSVLSEESSSPKTNFSRSKGSGRFSRFESDSNSAESDSDSDFNRDGSEYFTYSDERESIQNDTEIDSSLQESTGVANFALNDSSRDQLDVRLPFSEQVQKEVVEERPDEFQQFPETEATFVIPSKEYKTSNNCLLKTNDNCVKQEDVKFSKKPVKTENTASYKEKLCTSGSSIDTDSAVCSAVNYKDNEANKSGPNCQKHVAKENNSTKISFKLRNEKEKFVKKSISEKLNSSAKRFSYPHKREKREIVLMKPEKGDENKPDKHRLRCDLRMHLTGSACKESPHHISHSSSSSSENETSSSNSGSSRTCSGGRNSSRSSQSRSPIPVLKSVVGEVKQDRICEVLPTVSNLRREKSLRNETKTSSHSSNNRAFQNSDRKVTCLLPPIKEKSSNKSRKCEELPKKLPIHLRLGAASKHARRNDKRSSRLLQIGDEKETEERTRDPKYMTYENSPVEVSSSFIECSAKFNSQSRHHNRGSARKHSRKRSSEESLDNKGKRSHYSRKHHESGTLKWRIIYE